MTRPPGERTDGLAAHAAAAFTGYRDGDIRRMDELVALLNPLLWHCARGQGLDAASAQDVVQATWLALLEHADRIADPQAVVAWLLTSVRRASWKAARHRTYTEVDPETPDLTPGPVEAVEATERQRVVWRHLALLTPRCRALLRVVAAGGRPDYDDLSRALGMPVGSIGPTRGRCLAKLRTSLLGDPAWGGVG